MLLVSVPISDQFLFKRFQWVCIFDTSVTMFSNICSTLLCLFPPMCTRWKQLPSPNSSWPRIQCLWKMPGWYPGNWNPVWIWYSNNVNFPHLPLLMYFGLDLAGIKLFSKIISFLFLPLWGDCLKHVFIGSNILSLFRKLNSQVTFCSCVSFHCSNLNPSLKTSASDGLLIV